MMQDLFANIACAFLGTIGYAILYNVPKRFFFGCGFTVAAGWLAYLFSSERLMTSAATASFLGAFVVVMIARMLTVRLKCPITIFLISGILPLVPGAGIYYTVYYLVTNQLSMASSSGMEAIKVAFSIVLGIVLVVPIPRQYFQIAYWRKRLFGKVEAPK